MTLFERPFLHHFVNGAVGAEDALEEDYFVHFLVDVGLLLNGLDNLLEILFFAKVFDSSQSEMRDEILAVAEVADVIESCQNFFFKI